MSIIGKIVGINLTILSLYFIGVTFIGGYEAKIAQVALLGLVFIPSHIVICISKAINRNLSENETQDERKAYRRAYLLSALVILTVGFSFCTLEYG